MLRCGSLLRRHRRHGQIDPGSPQKDGGTGGGGGVSYAVLAGGVPLGGEARAGPAGDSVRCRAGENMWVCALCVCLCVCVCFFYFVGLVSLVSLVCLVNLVRFVCLVCWVCLVCLVTLVSLACLIWFVWLFG